MKNIICFLVAILSYATEACAQESDTAKYEIYYRLTIQKDTVEKNSVEDFMVLRTNGKKSIFFSKDAYTLDSLLLTSQGNAISMDILANGGGKYGKRINSFCILKDFGNGELEYTDNVGGDHFAYEEELPQMKWEIADEQKQVMSYNCQKAMCNFRGRKYEVWFTTEIPLNDGPWKFQGLPGLILEAADSARQYIFEFVGLNSSNAKIVLLDYDYKNTTREKYLKAYKNFTKDPIGYISASSGMKISLSGESVSRKKKPASKYDPMELF